MIIKSILNGVVHRHPHSFLLKTLHNSFLFPSSGAKEYEISKGKALMIRNDLCFGLFFSCYIKITQAG
jgi:hypothetical protein